MPRKKLHDIVDGEVVATRTEDDESYVQRVISESRAPTQYNKFVLAAQDWDNQDGTPNLFAGLSARERDLLYEMVLHLRANATDRAESRETLISEIAEEFEARGL
jgi:hypothetical protein